MELQCCSIEVWVERKFIGKWEQLGFRFGDLFWIGKSGVKLTKIKIYPSPKIHKSLTLLYLLINSYYTLFFGIFIVELVRITEVLPHVSCNKFLDRVVYYKVRLVGATPRRRNAPSMHTCSLPWAACWPNVWVLHKDP